MIENGVRFCRGLNPLIINGKIQTGKSYGIRLQKTCLWRLNTLTLMPNLHVIENQFRARRKNNKGGVSKSRNFFLHATTLKHRNDDAICGFCGRTYQSSPQKQSSVMAFSESHECRCHDSSPCCRAPAILSAR